MRRILWKAQDIIDAALDRLSKDRRWQIIDYLMVHNLVNVCRVNGYFWATCIGDNSIFDLGGCNRCSGQAYCYCGKVRS